MSRQSKNRVSEAEGEETIPRKQIITSLVWEYFGFGASNVKNRSYAKSAADLHAAMQSYEFMNEDEKNNVLLA